MERHRTSLMLTPLEMCEAGLYADALAAVSEWSDSPEKALVKGAALVSESPEEAKDLLSQASRLLSGDSSQMALIWLGCCYWATGEINEARVTLESVSTNSRKVAFALNLSRSIVESKNVDLALGLLREVEDFLESANPLWRGKWFNQKGYLLRRKDLLDGAIIAYEEARYWFEIAENPAALAGATNNLAAIFADMGEFERAHQAVDAAIESHKRTGSTKYLADALDQKATIFIAEEKFIEARNPALYAARLMEGKEQQETLARALLTDATALAKTQEHIEALQRIERATKIAEAIDNQELLFDIAKVRMHVAEKLLMASDIVRINAALRLANGSFREAAKKLNFTHPRLSRLISKYKLHWKGNKPLRSIIK